jgi:hypothetical protein
VHSHVVAPDAEFAFELGDDGETVTVEHDGGSAVDAEDLSVAVHGAPGGRLEEAWGQSGTEVTEGDATTVDLPDEADGRLHVVVVFDGREMLDHGGFDLSDGAD